jgi:hypothetical protein
MEITPPCPIVLVMSRLSASLEIINVFTFLCLSTPLVHSSRLQRRIHLDRVEHFGSRFLLLGVVSLWGWLRIADWRTTWMSPRCMSHSLDSTVGPLHHRPTKPSRGTTIRHIAFFGTTRQSLFYGMCKRVCLYFWHGCVRYCYTSRIFLFPYEAQANGTYILSHQNKKRKKVKKIAVMNPTTFTPRTSNQRAFFFLPYGAQASLFSY